MSFLELEDVGQLLRTSHRFWKLCQSEEFWESAVRQRCSTIPDEAVAVAHHIGWRHIFFTNKIHLQLIIKRRLKSDLEETPKDEPLLKIPDEPDEQSESSISFSSDEKRSSNSPLLSLSASSSSDHSSGPDPTSEPSFSPEDEHHSFEDDIESYEGEKSMEKLEKSMSRPSVLFSSSEDEHLSMVMKDYPERLKKYLEAQSGSPEDDKFPSPPSGATSSSEDEYQAAMMKELGESLKKSLPSPPLELISSSEDECRSLVMKEFSERLKNYRLSRGNRGEDSAPPDLTSSIKESPEPFEEKEFMESFEKSTPNPFSDPDFSSKEESTSSAMKEFVEKL